MIAGREDDIKARAHEIWEREGRPEGREREHWEQAEREIEEKATQALQGAEEPDRPPADPGPDKGIGSPGKRGKPPIPGGSSTGGVS